MLEIEAYMKKYFIKDIELNPDKIIVCVANKCWLYEKEIKIEDQEENPVVKDHCHLAGKFRG